MTARCAHGAPWYRVCPWCVTEARVAAYDAADTGMYPLWRHLTPAQAQLEVEHQALLVYRRQMMQRLQA